MKLFHLCFQQRDLIAESSCLGLGNFRFDLIRSIPCRQEAGDAFFDPLPAPLDLGNRKVAVTIVDGHEPAAINCNHGFSEQIQLSGNQGELLARVGGGIGFSKKVIEWRADVRHVQSMPAAG